MVNSPKISNGVKKKICLILLVAALIVLWYVLVFQFEAVEKITKLGKVDDWKYKAGEGLVEKIGRVFKGVSTGLVPTGPQLMTEAIPGGGTIGFATGGAKDINSFRRNVKENYLPLATDITYEGLFYDYYFDTGQIEECKKLFCPSYSYAISKDPFSESSEYYLSAGLNSGMKVEDFKRKKLNLVVVLDISGSMSSSFSSYYYDRFGNKVELKEEEQSEKTKMQVANESVVALLNHLKDDDRFGMVLFDDDAYIAKPLRLVAETDMESIKGHILEIVADGGTYMEAGMKGGTSLYDKFLDVSEHEYENRIIFLTDAMPNIGDISEEGLFGKTEKNSANKIYTTFIGIGVDFNTELVEHITKIRGANYYSVHSPRQFKEKMDEEFEYMVTPLVFNLKLTLEAQGYEIEKVYGSPEAKEATGELMKVNTLFPSKRVEGEVKGGLVLLKLKKTSDNSSLALKVSYEDRAGEKASSEALIKLEEKVPDFFENSGIRKGILLSRYVNLIRAWINDEREAHAKEQPLEPSVKRDDGIIILPEPELGKWERQSIPLIVSEHYKELFKDFKIYFKSEMDALGDENLKQEITILEKLSK